MKRFAYVCCLSISTIIFISNLLIGDNKILNPHMSYRDIQKRYMKFFYSIDRDTLIYYKNKPCLNELHIVYKILQYEKNEINISQQMINNLVNALIMLHHNGMTYIYVESNTRVLIVTILQNITFKYKYDIKSIEKWWKSYGHKTNRYIWAINSVEELLSTNLSFNDRIFLVQITGNVRILKQKKQDIIKWWKKMKDKSFFVWQRDSLDWALKNITDTDRNKQNLSYQILLNLIPAYLYRRIGINGIPTINEVQKNIETLKHWINTPDKKTHRYYKQNLFFRYKIW